jgi:hypothetical protein
MHASKGAKVRGDRNWERGIPDDVLNSKILRHFNQHLCGERDEDHLAAVVFWVLAKMHFEEVAQIKEQDAAIAEVAKSMRETKDDAEPVSRLAEIGRKLHLTEDLEKLTGTKLAPEMTDDELRAAVCRPKRAEVCQHCGGTRRAAIVDAKTGATEEIPCPMCCCRYCGKPKADHLNGDCP